MNKEDEGKFNKMGHSIYNLILSNVEMNLHGKCKY